MAEQIVFWFCAGYSVVVMTSIWLTLSTRKPEAAWTPKIVKPD